LYKPTHCSFVRPGIFGFEIGLFVLGSSSLQYVLKSESFPLASSWNTAPAAKDATAAPVAIQASVRLVDLCGSLDA
jgi:hypothetical protein